MVSTQMVHFTVNGDEVSLPVQPGQSLAKLLREQLRLTGTKIGCSEAECGSCTVVIEGKPILSCAYPAQRAEGKHVLTIEGLSKLDGNEDTLHPLQAGLCFIWCCAVRLLHSWHVDDCLCFAGAEP